MLKMNENHAPPCIHLLKKKQLPIQTHIYNITKPAPDLRFLSEANPKSETAVKGDSFAAPTVTPSTQLPDMSLINNTLWKLEVKYVHIKQIRTQMENSLVRGRFISDFI